MKYALVFLLVGTALIFAGFSHGNVRWLALWSGISFLTVAAAYAGLGAGVLGKRQDGTMAWWAVILLLPYLLFVWGLWHLVRMVSREDCYNEIAPGVWLGRRALEKELPSGVNLVVDLTAEFPEPKGVRSNRVYLCLPTLDDSAPDDEAFGRLVERVITWQNGVYIHCASGHGRSATVAAALLIAKEIAEDEQQAETLLKRARPGVQLNKAQRDLLARWRRCRSIA